jgi:PKD repeat protein
MHWTNRLTAPRRGARLLVTAAMLSLGGVVGCEAPASTVEPAGTVRPRATFEGTEANQAPVPHAGGPYSGTVGAPIVFDASGTTDADSEYLYYYWDFGDSTQALDTLPGIEHTYRVAGTYSVSVWVSDSYDFDNGNWTEATTTVVVSDPPPVVASTASGAGAGATLEVPGINASGTASPTTVAVTFDSVTGAGTVKVTPQYTPYAPAPAGFRLPYGGAYYDISTTAAFSGPIEVCLSYDPTYYYESGTRPRLLHGELVNGEAEWVDRTSWVDERNSVVCGTVTSFSPFALGAGPASAGTRSAPVLGTVSLPGQAVRAGGAVEVSVAFTDADAGDGHDVPRTTIAWGDGTTSRAGVGGGLGVSEPTALAAGRVRGTHAYTVAGVYTVRVTVTDVDGGSASTVAEYVVIYDPGAGFVTGSGWITSVAGAYKPNSTISGKASFGFVSRYEKGANRPSGNTQFQFHAANLVFRSTSYDWLIVSGPAATYRGTGMVTGLGAGLDGTYQFQLTVEDGQAQGGRGADSFRLRIFGGPAGLLYDNEWTKGPNDPSTTALGGGSIQVQAR